MLANKALHPTAYSFAPSFVPHFVAALSAAGELGRCDEARGLAEIERLNSGHPKRFHATLTIIMKSLEDWLTGSIKKPIAVLNEKYKDEDDVKKELDSLPLPKSNGYTVHSSHVSNGVIERLHKKIRGHSCEDAIWDAVLWYLAQPLPILIAHDLIDRAISTIMLGMTRQVDEVQWRLATFSEDALYTLIRERYVEQRYSVAQFETILEQYSYTIYSDSILYMLSYYETPSPDKKAALLAFIISQKRNWRKWKHIKKRLKQFMREQTQ